MHQFVCPFRSKFVTIYLLLNSVEWCFVINSIGSKNRGLARLDKEEEFYCRKRNSMTEQRAGQQRENWQQQI